MIPVEDFYATIGILSIITAIFFLFGTIVGACCLIAFGIQSLVIAFR